MFVMKDGTEVKREIGSCIHESNLKHFIKPPMHRQCDYSIDKRAYIAYNITIDIN